MIRLVIEVVDQWLPGWDTNDLIASAEHHHGLPFAPLTAVQRSKHGTARPKDAADIAALAAALPPPRPDQPRRSDRLHRVPPARTDGSMGGAR